jgi:NAD(P)-dependent dehydrogenase (short-subunit alcohol dehydrogenase family)
MNQSGTPVDILINNAAQTIARESQYYQTLIKEHTHIFTHQFPDLVDENGIQVDNSARNTWVKRMDETSDSELISTTLINYVAPFMLLKGLKKLMSVGRSEESPGFIVNVSSMEGKFTAPDYLKGDRHVQNNCAKAALNMMTRSLSHTLSKEHIFINSVETGWITDEFPGGLESFKMGEEDLFLPPLDEIDGASRILDPIFSYIAKEGSAGLFLKDYHRTAW